MLDKSCDVFIAGSGIVGSTFARRLVDRGATVIMADAGDFHSRRAGENRKNGWLNQRDLIQYGHFVRSQLHPVPSSEDRDYPAAMVSYAVGGMAVHWTCAIPRFHAAVERPSLIDEVEWDRLYSRAERLLRRHDDVFADSRRHQSIKQVLLDGGWDVRDTPMAARRRPGAPFVDYTGADTVLGPLAGTRANARFAIKPQTIVRKLVKGVGNTIDYAEVIDARTNELKRIHADHFVIAAGWLHNAQILWSSGLQADERSALGRYFSDHQFGSCTVLLSDALLGDADADDVPPHLYLPVSAARPWQGMIFRESYQFETPDKGAADARGIDLKWFGMIEPSPENRVTFTRDRIDHLGMPTPCFRLRLSPDDIALQHRMMADMADVAERLGPFQSTALPRIEPLGSAIHGCGLTRMGSNEDQGESSVVDTHSKVWGTNNLFVGGTSVIPTANAANPTLTAVALAIRSADSIAITA